MIGRFGRQHTQRLEVQVLAVQAFQVGVSDLQVMQPDRTSFRPTDVSALEHRDALCVGKPTGQLEERDAGRCIRIGCADATRGGHVQRRRLPQDLGVEATQPLVVWGAQHDLGQADAKRITVPHS
ncbi:hypothetical protein GCM10023175_54290 [Pseudonocardia xishanensis]|uniref:Uncharacterized protein n=1 Tax=Pseudonocardia xishanensis TaxID=630995 RepID=A0ABP8RZH3_9PSEU